MPSRAEQLTRLVLLGSALAFGSIGFAFLLAPSAMAARVDVSLAGATADNDVRAVYGGLQIGVAAFLVISASRPAWYRPALALQLLTFSGLAVGRFVSGFIVGVPAPLGLALHAAELAGFALGALAWRQLTREET